MKSRLFNTVRAIGQRWPLRRLSGCPRFAQTGIALGGAACVLTLSGCYYPYGYYPAGYYPYYATVPAAATQQAVPVGPADSSAGQQQVQPGPPATYAVAAPPVYVAPVYPAYYPPVYPAYYGYPGWWGPSVSIGFGFGGYWGGHRGWGGHGGWGGGHGHWH